MLKDGTYAAWYKTPLDQGTGIVHVADGQIWGRDSVRFYTTYSRQNGRTVGERFDPTPGEIAGKLRAMAHYGSQLENWLTRPHFMRSLDEYLVAP